MTHTQLTRPAIVLVAPTVKIMSANSVGGAVRGLHRWCQAVPGDHVRQPLRLAELHAIPGG